MEKQYGYLSRYKADSTHDPVEEAEFGTFLGKEVGAGKKRAFIHHTDGVFVNGSQNRGYVFYARAWSSGMSIREEEKRVPVFGLKENPKHVERTLNHYCYYICSQEELSGPAFFSHVFGSTYISAKEGTELANPQERLATEPQKVTLEWKKTGQEAALLVAEKLWEVQEQSPENRLLVLMEHADTESMKLLEQVYLLLPPQLRIQTGFATNISYGMEKKDDLQNLFEAERLPIYLMTMEKARYSGAEPKCGVPVQVFDLTEALKKTPEPSKRRKTLEMLSGIVSEKTDICLGFAEQQVLEQTGKVISFWLYQQIVDKLCSEDLYWWKKEGLDTIWQVKELFAKQKLLMDYEPLYREALYYFYTTMMEQAPYADEVNQMLRHTTERDQEMFEFLRDALHYGSEMDASRRLIEELDQEKQQEVNQTRKEEVQLRQQETAELKQQMQTALQEQATKLAEEQKRGKALTEVKEQQEKKILGLETEIQNFRTNFAAKETELQQAQSAQKMTAEQLAQKSVQAASLTTELEKSRAAETEQRGKIQKLQAAVDEMNRSVSETGVRDLKRRLQLSESERKTLEEEKETAKKEYDSLKAEHQDLKDDFEKAKKKKLIFTILTGVFGVTTVAGIAAAAWMGLQDGSAEPTPEPETQQVTEAATQKATEPETVKATETAVATEENTTEAATADNGATKQEEVPVVAQNEAGADTQALNGTTPELQQTAVSGAPAESESETETEIETEALAQLTAEGDYVVDQGAEALSWR